MKRRIILWSIVIAIIFAVWLYVCYRIDNNAITSDGLIAVSLFTLSTLGIIIALKTVKWRMDNGVDLFKSLIETCRKEVKSHMLFIMQYGHHKGIKGALNEFDDIFRNYPQWHLQDWVIFRAWYKDLIDHALKNPEIYVMTMKDGTPYDKDKDPLYDPEAPDWEQFDRKRYYDDYDDRDENDDDTGDSPNLKKAAEDGFYTGIGLGATDNFLNK